MIKGDDGTLKVAPRGFGKPWTRRRGRGPDLAGGERAVTTVITQPQQEQVVEQPYPRLRALLSLMRAPGGVPGDVPPP